MLDLVSDDADDDDDGDPEPPDTLRDSIYDEPNEDMRLEDLSHNDSSDGEIHGDAPQQNVRRSG